MSILGPSRGAGGQPLADRQTQWAREGRCSLCGGRRRLNGRGWWHRAGCVSFEQQDLEASVLRGAGAGMPLMDCGCRGDVHLSTTCTRWFEFEPLAEVGLEHLWERLDG